MRVPPIVWALIVFVVVMAIAVVVGLTIGSRPAPDCSASPGAAASPAVCASPTATP